MVMPRFQNIALVKYAVAQELKKISPSATASSDRVALIAAQLVRGLRSSVEREAQQWLQEPSGNNRCRTMDPAMMKPSTKDRCPDELQKS